MFNHADYTYPLAAIKPHVPANVQQWLDYRGMTFTDACCLVLVRYRRAPRTNYSEFTAVEISKFIANGLHYLPKVTTLHVLDLIERGLFLTKPVERAVVRHLKALGLLPDRVTGEYAALPDGVTCPHFMAHTQTTI